MKLSVNLQGIHHKWVCPDWKTYTTEHPMLQEHIKRLEAHGLKDPWIRNEAWRFKPNQYQTRWAIFKNVFFKNMHYGILIGGGLAALRYYFEPRIQQHRDEQWNKAAISMTHN